MEKTKVKRAPSSFSSGLGSRGATKKTKRTGGVGGTARSPTGGFSATAVVNRKRMVTSQPTERVSASARGGVARQKTSHTSKIESATASVSRLTASFRNLQTSVKDLRIQNDRLKCNLKEARRNKSAAENDVAAANNELAERKACIEEIEALRDGCKDLAGSIEADQRNLKSVIIEANHDVACMQLMTQNYNEDYQATMEEIDHLMDVIRTSTQNMIQERESLEKDFKNEDDMMNREIEICNDKIEKLQSTIKTLKFELIVLEDEKSTLRATELDIKHQKDQSTSLREEEKRQMLDLKTKWKDEKQIAGDVARELGSQVKLKTAELKEMKDDLSSKERNRKRLTDETKALQEEVNKKQQILKFNRHEYSDKLKSLRKKIGELKNHIAQNVGTASKVEKETMELNKRNEEFACTLNTNGKKLQEIAEKVAKATADTASAETEAERVDAEVAELRKTKDLKAAEFEAETVQLKEEKASLATQYTNLLASAAPIIRTRHTGANDNGDDHDDHDDAGNVHGDDAGEQSAKAEEEPISNEIAKTVLVHLLEERTRLTHALDNSQAQVNKVQEELTSLQQFEENNDKANFDFLEDQEKENIRQTVEQQMIALIKVDAECLTLQSAVDDLKKTQSETETQCDKVMTNQVRDHEAVISKYNHEIKHFQDAKDKTQREHQDSEHEHKEHIERLAKVGLGQHFDAIVLSEECEEAERQVVELEAELAAALEAEEVRKQQEQEEAAAADALRKTKEEEREREQEKAKAAKLEQVKQTKAANANAAKALRAEKAAKKAATKAAKEAATKEAAEAKAAKKAAAMKAAKEAAAEAKAAKKAAEAEAAKKAAEAEAAKEAAKEAAAAEAAKAAAEAEAAKAAADVQTANDAIMDEEDHEEDDDGENEQQRCDVVASKHFDESFEDEDGINNGGASDDNAFGENDNDGHVMDEAHDNDCAETEPVAATPLSKPEPSMLKGSKTYNNKSKAVSSMGTSTKKKSSRTVTSIKTPGESKANAVTPAPSTTAGKKTSKKAAASSSKKSGKKGTSRKKGSTANGDGDSGNGPHIIVGDYDDQEGRSTRGRSKLTKQRLPALVPLDHNAPTAYQPPPRSNSRKQHKTNPTKSATSRKSSAKKVEAISRSASPPIRKKVSNNSQHDVDWLFGDEDFCF